MIVHVFYRNMHICILSTCCWDEITFQVCCVLIVHGSHSLAHCLKSLENLFEVERNIFIN